MQPRVVATAGTLLAVGAAWLGGRFGYRQAGLLLIGAGLGLVLYHAAFGFTRAYRDVVTSGDARGLRAQVLMLALATLLFAPILAGGRGLDTAVVGAVAPASLSVLVGAFVFAIGMQLGGGCGSGTLFHLGSGATPLVFTLVGFVTGSLVATFHMGVWMSTPSLGVVSLGELLGWPRAVALQLAVLALIAMASLWAERRRGGVPSAPPSSERGWSRLVRGPWPLLAGGVALAVLNALTLTVAGHPWSITWAFALWGAKIVRLAGYDLSIVPFWTGGFQRAALETSVFADVTSVMDFGIMLGALFGAGLAGRFGPTRRVALRAAAVSLLGGLLLGYGARIAYGCNIGALFSGVASTSLHGWLWAVGALFGTPVGVRLRAFLGGRRSYVSAAGRGSEGREPRGTGADVQV